MHRNKMNASGRKDSTPGEWTVRLILVVVVSWTILNGLMGRAFMIGGALVSFYILNRYRPMLTPGKWFSLITVSFMAVIYIILDWLQNDTYQTMGIGIYEITLIFGVCCGMVLRVLPNNQNREKNSTELWFMIVAFILLIGATALVDAVDFNKSIANVSGDIVRINPKETTRFLWVFNAGNIFIGAASFTLLPMLVGAYLLIFRNIGFIAIGIILITWSVWLNSQLVTRTYLTVSIIAVSWCLFWWVATEQRGHGKTKRIILVLFVTGACIALVGLSEYAEIKVSDLNLRFRQVTQDSRIWVWIDAANVIARSPWGNSTSQLTIANWAHNYILDAGLTTGIFGGLAILVTLCVCTWSFVKLAFIGMKRADGVYILISCLGVGALSAAQLNPPRPTEWLLIWIAYGFSLPTILYPKGINRLRVIAKKD